MRRISITFISLLKATAQTNFFKCIIMLNVVLLLLLYYLYRFGMTLGWVNDDPVLIFSELCLMPGSHYRIFKILTDYEIWLQHTHKENLRRFFFPQILNMHTLQDLNIVAHHTLQDIKIIMPDGAPHVISRSSSSAMFTYGSFLHSTLYVQNWGDFTPALLFRLTVVIRLWYVFRHIIQTVLLQNF